MLIYTRDALLSAAGFKPVRGLKRSLRVINDAHDAVTPQKTWTKGDASYTSGGEPDHAIRLRAAELMTGLLGVSKAPEAGPDSTRPVNVNIVLASPSPAAVSSGSDGFTLRIARPPQVVELEPGQHQSPGDNAESVA